MAAKRSTAARREGEIASPIAVIRRRKALRRFRRGACSRRKGADMLSGCAGDPSAATKPCGAKVDLIAHLQNMPKEQDIDDVRVLIEGAGDANLSPLSARSSSRATREAARAERQRQMREARKKGKQLDPRVYRRGICDVGDVPAGKRLSGKRGPRPITVCAGKSNSPSRD